MRARLSVMQAGLSLFFLLHILETGVFYFKDTTVIYVNLYVILFSLEGNFSGSFV